ncbi:MAG: site-2 protease family protein [Eubacterium sp.]|nr:site-2 protease family protein [Eubacterium sp.]
MSFSSVWHSVYPILIAILFFELIIIIHEGGHFIAARLMGVKVNEFAIGMGPKIIHHKGKKTEFSLRAVPFGGFCAMEGEDEESDDENAFVNKKVWQRIFVVVAGAFMNLVLGFIILLIMTGTNNLVGTTTIAKFDDDAVSINYGLRTGDEIKSIDGMRIYTSNDISTAFTRSDDNTVDMTVIRDGEEEKITVTFGTEEYEGRQYIKMDFWLLGEEKNVGNVLCHSAQDFASYSKMVFLSLHDLIVGRFGLSDVSGPVGAVSVVSDAVKTSYTSMLRIMALLTINVGIFNLFPIPALDGWRLFILIGEGITRKKLPSKAEYAINAAGLIILLGFMCVVTFSDITKLF